jgi:ribosome biogenesis GTPase A
MLKEKLQRYKDKGIFKSIRIMVAGVPNTGKSTIINALAGGKKAVTGNVAGVTRGKQWVKIRCTIQVYTGVLSKAFGTVIVRAEKKVYLNPITVF